MRLFLSIVAIGMFVFVPACTHMKPIKPTGSPCADAAPWVRVASPEYHFSFEYPPSCFSDDDRELLTGLMLNGDKKEFSRVGVTQQGDGPESSPQPADEWVSAILVSKLGYGTGNGVEIIAAESPKKGYSYMLFACEVMQPIPEWQVFLTSPRHEVCRRIRDSIRAMP